MTIFDKVKSLVDVPTAARSYGVEVHRETWRSARSTGNATRPASSMKIIITVSAVRHTAMLSSWCRSFSACKPLKP